MSRQQVAPIDLARAVRGAVVPVQSVIDVGCGGGHQNLVPFHTCISIEPHPDSFALLQQNFGSDPNFVLLHGTWQDMVADFAPHSVDTVVAQDVLEHMTKDEGRLFLLQAPIIARCQVVIQTPLGFYPQNYDDPTLLLNGHPGLHWQTHQSGWLPEDFDESWTVITADGVFVQDGNGQPLDPPMGLLYAIWNRGTA